ncbi:MAG: hypothetical protein Roseis2KO_21060 [Roseivirga sp.]
MSFLFLFASLGVINGVLLSIYLMARKQKRVTDIYFAGMILMLCIRIGKSVLVYFNESTDRLILQIGLSACLFIGPFFYLYTRALQQNESSFKKKDLILLATLLFAIVGLGLIYPYPSQPEVWNNYMVRGIYVVWAFFLVFGFYQLRAVFKKAWRSPFKLEHRERYILAIALSTLFISLTYQFALFIRGFTYIWGSLIFSLSFYYLAGRALLSPKPVIPKPVTQTPLENGAALFAQVEQLMNTQKPFLNPKLKLDELAAMAGLSRHQLSRVLNEEYLHGFSHYVKAHRVNEARRLIKVRHELSLEGIGYEAGFSSKSSFFEAFKKITNTTPAAYKKSLSREIGVS